MEVMETRLLLELIMELADSYPLVGDLIFWFGIIWLVLCVVLNLLDLLAGVFGWSLDNKAIKVIRAICEKLGPSLSIFAGWAKNRVKRINKYK